MEAILSDHICSSFVCPADTLVCIRVVGFFQSFSYFSFTCSLMHESVSWLLARGKVDRAAVILAAISKTNGKSVTVDSLQHNLKVLNA